MDTKYRSFKVGGEPEEKDAAHRECFTVDEAIEYIGFGWFQIKFFLIIGFAWAADAMELMVLSILGPTLVCEWGLNSVQEAFTTTIVFVGFMFGAPVIGVIADKYGRRTSLMLCALWGAYYGLLSGFAPFYSFLLVLRALCGVGISGVPQTMTYFLEFLPQKARGKCMMMVQGFWTVGSVLEVCLAMLVLETVGWRWWLAASAIPLFIYVLLTLTVPESPRYLIASGRLAEARKALEQVALANRGQLPPGELKAERVHNRGSVKDLFSPEYLRTSVLLFYLWFATTFSYYGVVLMSTELIKSGNTCVAGETLGAVDSAPCGLECHTLTHNDYVLLIWTSFAELPGLFVTMAYLDYLGRKLTLGLNYALFGLTCFLLFVCSTSTYLLLMLFAARALISSAFIVLYVYTPEIYPTKFRAVGLGTCNVFARMGAVLTPFVAQVLLNVNMYWGLGLYGVITLLAAIVSLLLPYETRGKALKSGE